jgi:hypothetical protein
MDDPTDDEPFHAVSAYPGRYATHVDEAIKICKAAKIT